MESFTENTGFDSFQAKRAHKNVSRNQKKSYA